MPAPETNTRKIISRLEREGWVNIGGGSHDSSSMTLALA
jgi:hypothetical protein